MSGGGHVAATLTLVHEAASGFLILSQSTWRAISDLWAHREPFSERMIARAIILAFSNRELKLPPVLNQ